MIFNSLEFVIFFPLVTVLFFLFPHKFRWIHLLIASSIFYAAFIPAYLLILALLIIIDYTAGLLIERSDAKKTWLIVSIIANISLLGFFKYYNFFLTNINLATGSHFILLHFALPIGLSFHTFQSMSYTIEVYRKKQKAVTHLGYYALYVMFYPQLVAGPIERPYLMLPQLFTVQKFSSKNLYHGLRLMAWGFFKKLVIADRLGDYVDIVFSDPSKVSTANAWLAIIFFAVQIYADFSGYSDIAIGAAKTMGYDLMINFSRPYQSTNIRAFWQRWHISLSGWFRDYVYIPLGGNRKGWLRTNLNLLFTFALSGFWHGAGWTFIIWGLLHGLYMIIYNLFEKIRAKLNIHFIISWLLTIFCVMIAWIFFRSQSMATAFDVILKSIDIRHLSLQQLGLSEEGKMRYGNFGLLLTALFIGYMFLVERFTNPTLNNLDAKPGRDHFVLTSCLLLIIFYGIFNQSSFIYFQF